MERIIQEKISADHLLYVSLKYTKTCDVVLNLLARWKNMIEVGIDMLLETAKKKKMISKIPEAPKVRVDKLREIFRKNETILSSLDLYDFFKRIPDLSVIRENEFRKNVNLKVLQRGEWIVIDMDKLKEYASLLERFISELKHFL